MRRTRVVVVQVNGERMPQLLVAAYGLLEKALLNLAWQIGPIA
jgi:hypothetical protein